MASLKVIVDKDLTGVDFTVEIYLIAIHMLVLHILKTWQWVSILVWIATKFYQCILALSNFVKLKSILEFQKSNSQFTKSFWKSGKHSFVLCGRKLPWEEFSVHAMFLALLGLVSHQP